MCSITAEIMTDPVSTVHLSALANPYGPSCSCHILLLRPHIAPPRRERNQVDGFTYERSAIEQWLETHNTSPATGVSSSTASSSSRATISAASSENSTTRARNGRGASHSTLRH